MLSNKKLNLIFNIEPLPTCCCCCYAEEIDFTCKSELCVKFINDYYKINKEELKEIVGKSV